MKNNMTQEQKAKAYDEALERGKYTFIEIPFGAKDSELYGFEYAIPEGFEAEIRDGKVIVRKKESEDERIRRCIGMALTDVDEQRFKDFGTTLKDCLAYLEKQKELPFVKDVMLGYPGIYFYDGERMHFRGNPAMEEKQKESLHIPETCKENADSLTKEQDECPEYCVRSHCMGCPIYEKQKEQWKPIPLMNGDADLYFDNWIQHNDTTKRGCFEEGIRYAQRLQKEQKPVDNVSKEEYVKRFKALCDAYEIKLPNREYDIYGLCEDLHKLFGDIHKPAEWSEEDERIAYTILNLLCSQVAYVTGQGTTSGKQFPTYAKERDWFEKRFKSLRPQSKEEHDAIAKREYERGKRDGYWEGYKKAEENHNNSVTFHYAYPTSPSIKRSCYEGGPCTNPQMDCINCPRKSTGGMFNTSSSSGEPTLKADWKPSEEQMEALNYAIAEWDGGKRLEGLYALRNDLKKLM